MLWALLLLGVIPAAFAVDSFGSNNEDDDTDALSQMPEGDVQDLLSDAAPDTFPSQAILPDDPDEADYTGPLGDAADIIQSYDDPDDADLAGPLGSDTDTVVAPDTPDEDRVYYTLSDDGDTLVLGDDPSQGGVDADLIVENGALSFATAGTLNIVTGGAGDDTILAGDEAAVINAGDGNDMLAARDGSAIINGEAGDDTIYGGDDTNSKYVLDGGSGSDTIFGGAADEVIVGGTGADTLDGGAGDDLFVLDSSDTVTGGAGADDFWLLYDNTRDSGFVQITDFASGEDILRISINPATGDSALDWTVEQTDDGLSSQVVVNGQVLAVMQGVPNASAADIMVEFAP